MLEVTLYGHYVAVTRDRPVGAVCAAGAVMHRVFATQSLKQWPVRLVPEAIHAAHVNLGKLRGVSFLLCCNERRPCRHAGAPSRVVSGVH